MHVKQLTTSQALQTRPRKSNCQSRLKSFTSFSLERATGGGKIAMTCGLFEVTGQLFCIFHKSIATRYCLQTVQPASRERSWC